MRPNDSNEIIELNVGGYNYTTSRSTILSYPDSMLSRMISGLMPTATDSKQRIFIDRDGPIFRHILNFLRDKRLNLPENFQEFAQLRQEADFYGIEPMLTYLECCYHNRLNMSTKNLVSQSMQSLVSTSNLNNEPTASTAGKGGLYFTVVSKLYQGSLESLIGCVRILTTLSALDANSKRFMNTVMKQYFKGSATTGTTNNNNSSNQTTGTVAVKNAAAAGSPPNGTSINQLPLIDSFVCECKFMHEEKIICCKPCGMSGGADPQLVNLCQSIVRLAKRYGITTGYWEDMFYLTLESSVPNREQLCAKLREQHNAKLLSSAVCDRRYEENSTSTLVERWHLAEPTFACNS